VKFGRVGHLRAPVVHVVYIGQVDRDWDEALSTKPLRMTKKKERCWPTHEIATANIAWCIANTRGVGWGSYIRVNPSSSCNSIVIFVNLVCIGQVHRDWDGVFSAKPLRMTKKRNDVGLYTILPLPILNGVLHTHGRLGVVYCALVVQWYYNIHLWRLHREGRSWLRWGSQCKAPADKKKRAVLGCTRDCHCQYCMVYCIHTGGSGGGRILRARRAIVF